MDAGMDIYRSLVSSHIGKLQCRSDTYNSRSDQEDSGHTLQVKFCQSSDSLFSDQQRVKRTKPI